MSSAEGGPALSDDGHHQDDLSDQDEKEHIDMSDVDDDPIERTDEVTNGPIPDGHSHPSTSPHRDQNEKHQTIETPLNVVVSDPKTDINRHTIVVGPCSPSDGERTPSGISGSEPQTSSGIKENNHSPQNLSYNDDKSDVHDVNVEEIDRNGPRNTDDEKQNENVTRENNNTIKHDDETETKSTSQDDDQSRPGSNRAPSLSPQPAPHHSHPSHMLFSPASIASGIKDHLFGDLPTRSLPPTFLASHHDPIFSLQAAAAADHRSRHSLPLPFSL